MLVQCHGTEPIVQTHNKRTETSLLELSQTLIVATGCFVSRQEQGGELGGRRGGGNGD